MAAGNPDLNSANIGRIRHPRQASAHAAHPHENFKGKTTTVILLPPAIEDRLRNYIQHIHLTYPIVLKSELREWIKGWCRRRPITEKHQRSNAPPEKSPKLTSNDAVLLLVLEVGGACAYGDQDSERVTDVGDGSFASYSHYSGEVARMIKSHDGGTELYEAQRLLLAGLYNALIGRGDDSAKQFKTAETVLRSLLDRNNVLLERGTDKLLSEIRVDVEDATESIEEQLERNRVASERIMKDGKKRRIVMAAWACLRFQRNNFFADPKKMTGLCEIKHLLPTLTEFPGKSLYGITLQCPTDGGQAYGRKTISWFYLALTFIEGQLDQIRGEVYGEETHGLSRQTIRRGFPMREEIVDGWKKSLPDGLAWDKESLSSLSSLDLMQAQLCAAYWESIRTINEPLLEYALQQHGSDMDGTISSHIGKPLSHVRARLYEAFDGMEEVEVMLACTRCVRAAEQITVLFGEQSEHWSITNTYHTADTYAIMRHSMRARV